MTRFAYTAEKADGTTARGVVDAVDRADAQRQLAGRGLRVIDLGVFDGLPMESGLAALSGELRRGRLRRAVDSLVGELRDGVPLERAVATPGSGFPPLYGHLIDAGLQSGELPAVLGRFGRHARTLAELRESLWRAATYPVIVLIALLLLLTFLGYAVLPKYYALLGTMAYPVHGTPVPTPMRLPVLAWGLLYAGRLAPFLLIAIVLAGVGGAVVYRTLRASGRERGMVDAMAKLPLVGRPLRDSGTAMWLDVASIGTAAGLDLPRALRLAADAVALPSIGRDTASIVNRLEAGQTTGDVPLVRLPQTLPVLIDLSEGPGRLTQGLRALADQYEQQARREAAVVPGRVMPALLITIGLIGGVILYSLWLPLMQLLGQL